MIPRLHLVTDDALLANPAFPAVAERVLDCCGSYAALHVRGHRTGGAALYSIAERLHAAAARTGAWLLVNDRVDVAFAVRAHGTQLGARSLPVAHARALLGASARIGCSVHAPAEALQAAGDGADFVLLGTIFESASHPAHAREGTGMIADTAARVPLPVIAIGGITPERIREVAGAGAHGAAILGGVWRAQDPVTAAEEYMAAMQDAWREQDVQQQDRTA